LHHAKVFLEATVNDGLGIAPYNALMGVACLTSREMIDAINYSTFGGKREWLNRYKISSNGSVIEELFTGFSIITQKFILFGQRLLEFGTETQIVTNDLQERIGISVDLINRSFKEFTDVFYAMFYNLSFTLKGENPLPPQPE